MVKVSHEDVPVVEYFTGMQGDSYNRGLRSFFYVRMTSFER